MRSARRFGRVLVWLGLLTPVWAGASPQIAEKAGCNACHTVDKKVLGPSWREVAARYKGKADAPALLAARVRKGSKDVWGPVPMPATEVAKLNDADLKAVIAWVLKTP
jgi:cytochrome c